MDEFSALKTLLGNDHPALEDYAKPGDPARYGLEYTQNESLASPKQLSAIDRQAKFEDSDVGRMLGGQIPDTNGSEAPPILAPHQSHMGEFKQPEQVSAVPEGAGNVQSYMQGKRPAGFAPESAPTKAAPTSTRAPSAQGGSGFQPIANAGSISPEFLDKLKTVRPQLFNELNTNDQTRYTEGKQAYDKQEAAKAAQLAELQRQDRLDKATSHFGAIADQAARAFVPGLKGMDGSVAARGEALAGHRVENLEKQREMQKEDFDAKLKSDANDENSEGSKRATQMAVTRKLIPPGMKITLAQWPLIKDASSMDEAMAKLQSQEKIAKDTQTGEDRRATGHNQTALQVAMIGERGANERASKAADTGVIIPGYKQGDITVPQDERKLIRDAYEAQTRLEANGKEWKQLHDKYGTELVGPQAVRMRSLEKSMDIDTKTMDKLGNLVGGDWELLAGKVPGATTLGANAAGMFGADYNGEKMDELIQTSRRGLGAAIKSRGLQRMAPMADPNQVHGMVMMREKGKPGTERPVPADTAAAFLQDPHGRFEQVK